MQKEEVKVCILRIEGTNCEAETWRAFRECGARAEIVHLKQIEGRCTPSIRRDLEDYHILLIPGGFSAGDYIRAGAIFAARLRGISNKINKFIDEGKLIGGICNGFQVLVELGLIPGFDNCVQETPDAVLNINDSVRFECRHIFLKTETPGRCAFTQGYTEGGIYCLPVAHAEGKFIPSSQMVLERMIANRQILFRYCTPDGDIDPPYPYNPNGSTLSIAGVCNISGTVIGMMPHPERAFFSYSNPGLGCNRGRMDGRPFFESAIRYICKVF
jgi:phosphoribosylformylglycinamidine synthase I